MPKGDSSGSSVPPPSISADPPPIAIAPSTTPAAPIAPAALTAPVPAGLPAGTLQPALTAIDMAAGQAFLASPAATRIALGRAVATSLAVVSGYKDPSGRPCRVIEQAVLFGTETVHAVGTVCEQANGRWALVP